MMEHNPERNWHASDVTEVLDALGVELDSGLAEQEVPTRLERYGPNQLREAETRPWWRVLLAQFRSIVVCLLGGAAVLALATGRLAEGIAVLAVLLVNTAIGFMSEWRAVRSMAALRKLGEHITQVRRDGRCQSVSATEIVPGDVVMLEAGALVPADLRVAEADHLRVNEAPLTGESVPVDKLVDAVSPDAALADRKNMLFKGTSVSDGNAVGVAVATGTQTQLGRISELAERAEAASTPLQRRLDQLGRRLALLTLAIAAFVAVAGFLVRQQEAKLVIETALALGIAAIPEGLPIVATIALARGMYLMAKRNALVNQLTAVETLGATRVVFTDKTGTLTENRMRLQEVVSPTGALTTDDDGSAQQREAVDQVRTALEVAVLCNAATLDAEASEDDPHGDPTEVALLSGARELGIERAALLEQRPEVRVEDFDPQVKKMASFHAENGTLYVAVKGAPKAVLDVCQRIASGGDGADVQLDEDTCEHWLGRARELAGKGLRVLAVADKQVDAEDSEPYEDLRFVGLVGLLDPPRKGVKQAIDSCQTAGIRVEMVTGDQPETAEAIAHAVGIVGDEDDPEAFVMLGEQLDVDEINDQQRKDIYRANIFARFTPEQKLNLVRVYQDQGEVVAMTGDGINDAPALKKADIGIAMGKRGTEAAKQAADMVLKDDAFETIVAAVEQGRVIFGNIRKSIMFMLTTNVAEVIAVTVATLAGWTLPLLPLQILYLNVITDVFPALALGVGPASGSEMQQPPRDPRSGVLGRAEWLEISGLATVLATCVLGGLLLGQHWLGLSEAESVTVSFLTIAFGKLWFTFVLRAPTSGFLRNEVTRNAWVWGATALCVGLLLAAVYLPGLSQLLRTTTLDGRGWGLLLGMSIVPFIAGQILRVVQARLG